MGDLDLLTNLMMEAHLKSALNNDNLSSSFVMQMASAGKSFTESMATALLSLGNLHGPVTQCRQVLYYMEEDQLQQALDAGMIIPGFGNAFYKDGIDPAWDDFVEMLKVDFTPYHERIEEISKRLSDKKGTTLYPNPASFTATVAELLNMPVGTEISLAVSARIPAWVEQWSGNR